MKRIMSTLLSVLLAFSVFGFSSKAEESNETVMQSLQLLGIMNGDEYGDMNLSANVSRAQFAKMMVSTSIFKDAAEGFGFSVFSDVRAEHWAAGYVKIAVQEGWFVGYLDGTFRPEGAITLEEGATACLRLLGYTKLPGTYPNAQMAKYRELDLDDNVIASPGQPLSRYDCMHLFFNLLNAKTASGVVYASTLGHALTGNGELDTLSLVKDCTDGPYIVQNSGMQTLTDSLGSDPTVYKNNKLASISDVFKHDVYYYNEDMRTVWAYNDRVTGRLTGIDSLESPKNVTVAGNSYSFATNEAAHQFSWAGSITEGDLITLLFGRDEQIAGTITAQASEESRYGIVLAQTLISYSDATGKTQTEHGVKVAMTDGTIQEYGVGKRNIAEKSIVSVSFADGTAKINSIRSKQLSGSVNASASKLGNEVFADGIEIMDVNAQTCQTVYPSRLAGSKLTDNDIIYYAKNSAGEIDTLILDDVTGDLYTYSLLTDVSEISAANYLSGFYMYMIDGRMMSKNLVNAKYNVSTGGAMMLNEDGMLSGMKNLNLTKISDITDIWAKSGSDTYMLADNLQVYERANDIYTQVSLESVSDLNLYSLTGYYDAFGFPAGEQIRVITAVRK